jgi:hypothetical protein
VSLPVELAALVEQIEAYGPLAHLITVSAEGLPHVVAVRVGRDEGELIVEAGKRTTANVEARPGVTVLWAAPPGTGYSLIVDGTARPQPEATLRIAPAKAVLHRTPEGDAAAPSCITVLARS